jgi:hypothetical protein
MTSFFDVCKPSGPWLRILKTPRDQIVPSVRGFSVNALPAHLGSWQSVDDQLRELHLCHFVHQVDAKKQSVARSITAAAFLLGCKHLLETPAVQNTV